MLSLLFIFGYYALGDMLGAEWLPPSTDRVKTDHFVVFLSQQGGAGKNVLAEEFQFFEESCTVYGNVCQ